MNVNVNKSEIKKVVEHLNAGGTYENMDFQFVKRASDGVMLRYDLASGEYKFYTDLTKFASAIVRFQKRGY